MELVVQTNMAASMHTEAEGAFLSFKPSLV